MRPHHPHGAPAAAAAAGGGYGGPRGMMPGQDRNVRPRQSGGGMPVGAGGPAAGQAGFKPGERGADEASVSAWSLCLCVESACWDQVRWDTVQRGRHASVRWGAGSSRPGGLQTRWVMQSRPGCGAVPAGPMFRRACRGTRSHMVCAHSRCACVRQYTLADLTLTITLGSGQCQLL
jgi:hypothetical protein